MLFGEAIHTYDEAIAIQPNELTYFTHRRMAWVEQGTLDEAVCFCRDILKWKDRINASHQDGALLDEKVAFVCLCTDFAAVTIALRPALVTHRNDQVKHAIIAHIRLMDLMYARFRAPRQSR